MMQATAFEYRHRYLVHGLIYTLGFAAPWHLPAWNFLQNQSGWFLLSNSLARPSYQHFALYWNVILGVIILLAAAGAWLRTWGAAYLGASTVHRGGMEGDRVIANGPYRFTRNPLYLGTILNTLALAWLMRPEAAALTITLIVLVQYRLIGREEPYLQQQLGATYMDYRIAVPRLLPSFHAGAVPSNALPNWRQGVLSEIYTIGCAFSFLLLGWSAGYAWETNVLHVIQGIVVAHFSSRRNVPALPRAACYYETTIWTSSAPVHSTSVQCWKIYIGWESGGTRVHHHSTLWKRAVSVLTAKASVTTCTERHSIS